VNGVTHNITKFRRYERPDVFVGVDSGLPDGVPRWPGTEGREGAGNFPVLHRVEKGHHRPLQQRIQADANETALSVEQNKRIIL
jgi:hypothetical protein